ncbi:hypothetical protein BOS5A_200972 [Bosea sp. EC-HK365B]|nr:hypothetical protein BOSE21B_110924 [Bosea sp. 21B]CAD5275890.1 hypothetical protein BOSE7B_40290 [Bosea sp. 7B]VVT59105.1 hypothetical protein BOS5A_200972 [Bosea sp. EC-HK365B]VXC76381.1 hypothetical protein BOSE127_40466 [Bosea sp. 127]
MDRVRGAAPILDPKSMLGIGYCAPPLPGRADPFARLWTPPGTAFGVGPKGPLRHAVPRRAQPRPRSFRRRERVPGTPRPRPSACGQQPCSISYVLYMFSLIPSLFTSISQGQLTLGDAPDS